jgi:phage-related protein
VADEGGAVDVGTAYISIIPSARGFAKKLRAAVEAEIKDLDLDKVIGEKIGKKPIVVPVKTDLDTTGLAEKLKAAADLAARRAKAKVKVDVDVDKKDAAASIGGALKGLTGLLPDIGGITSKVQGLIGSIQDAAGSSVKLGGNLAGAVATATGPVGAAIALVGALAAGVAAVGAAAIFAAPAISAAAGAIASIPAVAVGGGAALATLALGLRGLAAAFKPVAGGGGGGSAEDPASRARRIAGAERGIDSARRGIASATRGLASAERNYQDSLDNVTQAQARAAKAQTAVNKAREEAAEDIDDLRRALTDAKLDEEDATLAVTEAQRALAAAQETGNIPDIERANLEYRKSVAALDDAKDAADDLSKASDESTKKGVEGSDKVQSALQDQADAFDQVKQAQQSVVDAHDAVLSANESLQASYDGLASANDSLAEAQKKTASSGGAAAAQVIKLAPAAQKFVNAVKALGPAFDALRLDVQERLFKGLDKTVTNLGEAWVPQLRITLGSYADTFNTFFRDLGATLTTPKVISDLAAGAESVRSGLAELGKSVSGPLVQAFASLSAAASPFVTQLFHELAGVVDSFSTWVKRGEKSGALKEFFETAAQAVKDIFAVGRTVASIIGSIITIIIGKPQTSGKTPIQTFQEGLQKIADYLGDPGNQEKIRNFITKIEDAVNSIIGLTVKVASIFDSIKHALGGDEKGAGLGADIGSALITGMIAGITAGYQVLVEIIKANFGSITTIVKKIFGIQSPSTVFAEIGKNIMAGLTNGIRDGFTALTNLVGQLPGKIRGAIGKAGDVLYNTGHNIMVGLTNGINSLIGTVGTYAGYARNAITNVFTKAGSLLYNAGRSIVSGLINGIASMIGTLGNYLHNVGTFIQNNKGPIAKDRKLLVGAGQAIMQGLIVGIASQRGALGSELAGVTGQFDDLVPQLTANPTASIRSSSTSAASLTLGLDPSATSDGIMREFAKFISVRYNGDPVAALGTGTAR